MNIAVERKGYNTAIIEWDEQDVVKLYKQNNEGDAPVLLAETAAGIYIDEDDKYALNNPLYYIEKGALRSLATRADSIGDNYLYMIADNYQWQLRTLPRGFSVQAYIKSHNAQHCPECYSETLKKQIKTICDTCDGSSMLYAFKGPVSIYMGITLRKKEKIYEELKEREEETIQAWTGNAPYLKQGDILYFNGMLYVIHHIPNYVYAPSESGNNTFLLRQEFIVVRLDRNNHLYGKLIQA